MVNTQIIETLQTPHHSKGLLFIEAYVTLHVFKSI